MTLCPRGHSSAQPEAAAGGGGFRPHVTAAAPTKALRHAAAAGSSLAIGDVSVSCESVRPFARVICIGCS